MPIMPEQMILYRKKQDHKQPKADRITSRWRVSLYGPYLVEMGQALLGGQDQRPYKDIRVRVKDSPPDRQQQGFLFPLKASNSKPR